VVITEKLHGTNCRIGVVEGAWMAGSKEVRRVEPVARDGNTYWFPLSLGPVRQLLEHHAAAAQQVILYGEVYSSKIQSLHYGAVNELGFRAFDLLIDGRYLDYADFKGNCNQWGVETVPEAGMIPYDLEQIRLTSAGPTLMAMTNPHRREGIVVRPIRERQDSHFERAVFKYVSDAHLLSTDADFTDV